MSYEEHPGAAIAWAITALVASIVFIVAIITDIVIRWGEPLVVYPTDATILWAAAWLVAKIAEIRLKAMR